MEVQIENYFDLVDKGSAVAEFTIYFPEIQMRLHKARLIRTKNGNQFPSLPSFSVDVGEGRKVWKSYIEFSKERWAEIEQKILDNVKHFQFWFLWKNILNKNSVLLRYEKQGNIMAHKKKAHMKEKCKAGHEDKGHEKKEMAMMSKIHKAVKKK